jgi:hypothetical protein
MRKRRKTRITIETERVVLRRPRRESAWCPECAEPCRMVSADEAALLLHTSTRAICRLVDASRVHFTEDPDGLLMICFKSLINAGYPGL